MFVMVLGFVSTLSCAKKKVAEPLVADSVYLRQGNNIVALAFDTLRKSLFSAISVHGMAGAIGFCNEKAFSITDIYADSVTIKRTSLRLRNVSNKPDSLERVILNEMKMAVATSTPVTKIMRDISGEVHFFKPIMLQAMCLNCHGTRGVQIQENTLAKINQFYPDDRAVDFKEGDLRGIWHIIFKNEK
jgi:hypothetical protein